MVGRIISHYEILEKLGESGMGVVYKARDTHLERFVAIKVLPPERVADPERRRRGGEETQVVESLGYCNNFAVLDSGYILFHSNNTTSRHYFFLHSVPQLCDR
jgi:serine/threonine protein kinase